jgi:pimeloyl-ACP methyl ester carboxylesterase
MSPVEISLPVAWGELAALRCERPGCPRVIAVHGWLDNAASFLPMLPHLDELDLVMLDLPGHGRSGHLPAGIDYGLGINLHAVLDVADHLGWEQFNLLGHSMGAATSVMVAVGAPQRVQRLALIETLGPLSEEDASTAQRVRQSVEASRRGAGRGLRTFPGLDVAIRARMQANQIGEAGARHLVERGTRQVEGGFTWSSDPRLTLPSLQRFSEAQIQDLLRSLACPVRMIYAERAQPYFPEDQRRRRAEAVAGLELVRMPGGHHLHMDDPAAVAAVFAGFFH